MSKTKKRLLIYISLEFILFLLLIIFVVNNVIYNAKINEIKKSYNISREYINDTLKTLNNNDDDNLNHFYIEDGALYYNDLLIGDGNANNSSYVNEILKNIAIRNDFIVCVLIKEGDIFRYVASSNYEHNVLNKTTTISQANNLEKANYYYDGTTKYYENDKMNLYYFNSYPIKDEDNNVIGILTISKNMNEIYDDVYGLLKKIILIIIILIPSFIFGLELITRRWTKATNKINNYINNINLDNLPNNKLLINTSDEFSEIANSINHMVNDMKSSTRLVSEVKTAANVQQKMLSDLSYIKEYINIDLEAKMIPAKEIGGDFYNTFKIDDEHICLCVGDVSGKGVPASILMAVVSSLIKTFILDSKDPSIVLTRINKALLNFDYQTFITCFLGILNIETGELVYCNAGHNRPLIIGEKIIELDCLANIVLGVKEYKYKNQNFKLKHGNNILIYTDGLTESINEDDEEYGLKRLTNYIKNYKGFNLLDDLYQDIYTFNGKKEQFDDMTALLLLYNNNTSISLKNDLQELKKLNKYIEANIQEKKLINNIELGLEELFVNIVNYSHNTSDIKINIQYLKNIVRITIIDSGIDFNPLTYKDIDINKPLEEKEIGGLGIHIVKQIFNKIEHYYINNKNILILEKEVNNEDK